MNLPNYPDFMRLPNLQDADQAREEIAFNDITAWMLDDEGVMLEVVTAMHTEMPLIEHAQLVRAVMTRNPVELLKARSVIEAAIQHAAQNRANRAKIISAQL